MIVLAVLVSAASAGAQITDIVTPPFVQGSTDVAYPAGARGNAIVVLELQIDEEGTVVSAIAIDGVEPFVEQARRAVLAWPFTPARRGDTPVAARIRAIVEFRQEKGSSEPSPTSPLPSEDDRGPAAPTPSEPLPSSAGQAPAEVTVRGQRQEIGQTRLSAADVREMPGAFGDAFRAVDALPGVTPLLSGLPYFFIRGAPPNDNGYFLDGVRVPLLFHIALGPGVIHPGLLDHVDFHPSAPPASYGGFAGAIIAGQTRAPAATWHGAANLRLVDAGALVESPFAEGRGSALLAGRYGYPGPIVGTFSDTKLGYWDYQTRVAWKIAEDDSVSVFAFGSHDSLAHRDSSSRGGIPATGSIVEDFVSDFHRIDLRYDHRWVDGRVRAALTLGLDSQGAAPTYLRNRSGAVRVEFEQAASTDVRVRAGAEARIDAYAFGQGAPLRPDDPPVPSGVDPPPTDVTSGVHGDVVWRVAPGVEIVPGARFDLFHSSRRVANGTVTTTVPAFDPRLSARVAIVPALAWLSTFGLASQYPALRVGNLPAAVVTGSGFPLGGSRLQTAIQASQGLEMRLPAEIVVTVTGFVSDFTGLTDLTEQCVQLEPAIVPPAPPGGRPPTPFTCPNEGAVHGHAYGLELLARRPLSKRLSGWLSYTLSRSVRETHFVTLDGTTTMATLPSEFDRTHVLNAVLAYDLGRRWRAGTRFVFYTGTPFSALSGNIPVPPYNAYRDPPFFRLDVRLEKSWELGANGSIAFVLEGQNVTLSKESTGLGTSCMENVAPAGGTNACTRATLGPITIPSVGVEALF